MNVTVYRMKEKPEVRSVRPPGEQPGKRNDRKAVANGTMEFILTGENGKTC